MSNFEIKATRGSERGPRSERAWWPMFIGRASSESQRASMLGMRAVARRVA
jgi:hypothetical protein